jgi:glutamyl-tRNA synthetase
MANRYMVVTDPIKMSVRNAPKVRSALEPLHVDFPERGRKRVPVDTKGIYISKADARELNRKEFRLKGLFNIRLGGNIGVYTGNEVVRDMPKIQWVSSDSVEVIILMPDGSAVHGIAEPALMSLKVGDVLQMERMGFGRVDKKTNKGILIAFAHR